MDPTKAPGIRFDQIFLRTARLSHREDALQLAPRTSHPTDARIVLRLQSLKGAKAGSGGVSVTVSTDPSDTRLLYQFEVEMLALLREEVGEENMPVDEYVKGAALVALVPFLREAIANLTMRGRFGPVWLSPINLQQFLLEQSKKLSSKAEPGAQGTRAKRPKRPSKKRIRA